MTRASQKAIREAEYARVLSDLIATERRDLLAEALDVLHGGPVTVSSRQNSPQQTPKTASRDSGVRYASVTPPDLKDARNGGTSDTPRLAPLRAAEPVFTRPAYEHDDDRAYRRRTRSAQFRQTGDIA